MLMKFQSDFEGFVIIGERAAEVRFSVARVFNPCWRYGRREAYVATDLHGFQTRVTKTRIN
jgi:hypothetical protein